MKARAQKFLKLFGKSLLALLALPALYLAAALVGALVPANAGWQPPRDGITIFVRTNGVHTWVMVPTVSPDMDWRRLIDARDIRDPRYAGDYLAIGWGSREFYLNTPTWDDLSAGIAARALFGNGPTLMHVDHAIHPEPDEWQQPIRLSREQYRRLTRFILASFAFDASGRPVPLLGKGYGPSDAFYVARGRYNLFRTSNVWTGAALRGAGVRVGIWTPFAASVTMRIWP